MYDTLKQRLLIPGEKNDHLRQRSFTMLRFVTIIILVAAVPFAIFVWPTKYAYDHLKVGESDFPVRIHRVTSDADYLTPTGWRPLKAAQAQAQSDGSGQPAPAPSPNQSGRPITTTPTPNL